MTMGRPKQIDYVGIELMGMSDADFKKKYMTKSLGVTPESVWAQVPQCTSTPDEGESRQVHLDRNFNRPPSEMRYFRTWGVSGWK